MIDSEPTDPSQESTEPSSGGSTDASSDEPTSSSSLVSGGELTDEGKREVARWIEEGLGLSDVQRRLSDEHGFTLTYMETRFLIDDLELALQDPDEPEAPATDAPEDGAIIDGEEGLGESDETNRGVVVEVDKVVRPGAIVSGSVTFSDGVTLQWHLDQMGQLGISPKEGYQPSEEDLMAFQEQLRIEMGKAGY